MSIDEAIEKHRRIAETKKTLYDACILEEYNRHLLREYKEHEHLAEWLEELKAYREIGTVEGYKSAIKCYTEEYTIRKSNKQYNKAIDDFVAFTKEHEYKYGNADITSIVIGFNEFIAEQLKAGVENEETD